MLEHIVHEIFPFTFTYDKGKRQWYAEDVIDHILVRFVIDKRIPPRDHRGMPENDGDTFDCEVTGIVHQNPHKRFCLATVQILGPSAL